jgi:hypothetical protein
VRNLAQQRADPEQVRASVEVMVVVLLVERLLVKPEVVVVLLVERLLVKPEVVVEKLESRPALLCGVWMKHLKQFEVAMQVDHP